MSLTSNDFFARQPRVNVGWRTDPAATNHPDGTEARAQDSTVWTSWPSSSLFRWGRFRLGREFSPRSRVTKPGKTTPFWGPILVSAWGDQLPFVGRRKLCGTVVTADSFEPPISPRDNVKHGGTCTKRRFDIPNWPFLWNIFAARNKPPKTMRIERPKSPPRSMLDRRENCHADDGPRLPPGGIDDAGRGDPF
jgi:hypothetical protein